MAIDPNIALQVRPFQMESPVNALGQMYQLQGAQQANQLNTMKMAEYERARQEEEGVRNYLTGADIKAPETRAELATKFGKTGLGYAEALAKQDAAALEQKIKQMDYTAKVTDAAASIYGTVKDDASWQAAKPKLAALGGDASKLPDTYDPNFVRQEMLAATKVKDQLTLFAPKPKEVKRADGSIIFLDENPNSPTYGKEVLPAQATGMTPFQTQSLGVSRGQLNLAKEKFDWEKANPGFELKEAEDGSIVGVNKRTLQAIPVTMGATTTAGTGMPSARVPAIPGMTSVLDQQAPATGKPLMGKGQNMTESQGAAAAYGMRMKEANSVLAPLEKAGVKNTGVISGTVGGIVGLVPLIGDKLESATGSVFNSLPQILGGLSPEQQQVAQARINFITAVLRKESGASISPSEFITAEKNYFPKPGDDSSTIAQKQKARETAIKAMEVQAGPGAKFIQQHQPNVGGGGVDTSNPLLK